MRRAARLIALDGLDAALWDLDEADRHLMASGTMPMQLEYLSCNDCRIAAAVLTARAAAPMGMKIEVEVDTLEQLDDALSGKPDIVLLDNMRIDELRQAVALRNERAAGVELEASGGVSLGTVAAIAATGVERISVGALTHSAPALDLAFEWK